MRRGTLRVGCARDNMETALVTTRVKEAAKMAFDAIYSSGAVRIHHSDRGSQYASESFRLLLEQEQMLQSMSRKGRVPLGQTMTTLWRSHSGRR